MGISRADNTHLVGVNASSVFLFQPVSHCVPIHGCGFVAFGLLAFFASGKDLAEVTILIAESNTKLALRVTFLLRDFKQSIYLCAALQVGEGVVFAVFISS